MFYTKIKKTFSIIMSVILFSFIIFVLSSCADKSNKNDNEPKPICEISYMWNGEMQTQHSTATPLFGERSSMTKEEYYALPIQYRFLEEKSPEVYQAMTGSFVFINLSKESSKPDTIIGLTEADKEKEIGLSYRYQIFNSWETGYRKAKFLGFVYNYLYVEVLDHQTLSITNWQGTTVYTVSCYSITYFNDLK